MTYVGAVPHRPRKPFVDERTERRREQWRAYKRRRKANRGEGAAMS